MSENNENNNHLSIMDVLKIRDYRQLWLGQMISNFGDSLTGLATLLLINELTGGSTSALALGAIMQAIPRITIGLLAGVLVDRIDRKRIMILSDVVRGVLVLGLVFVNSADWLWLLYVLSFLQASVSTFFLPARTAYIPRIVPKEGLLAANSLSQTTLVIMNVVGTAAAGGIIGAFDIYWPAFIIDSVTFMLSAVFIGTILTPAGGEAKEKASARVIFKEMGEGFKLVGTSRSLMGIVIAMGVAMLGIGAVNILLVPLIINDLQVSEAWFAAFEGAQTLSMVLSGALVTILATRFKAPQIITVGMIALGVAVGLISQVTGVWGLIVILFGIGWVMTPLQASLTTVLQESVEDAMRGRAGAAFGVASQSASVISMAAAGVVADAIGTRAVFIIGGSIIVLAGIVTAWIFRGYEASPQTPAVEAVS